MSKVIEIKKKANENNEKLKQEFIEGLTTLPDNIKSALIAFRTDDGTVHTGFFNSNLVDEAVMLKMLDMDIMQRQWARDSEG